MKLTSKHYVNIDCKQIFAQAQCHERAHEKRRKYKRAEYIINRTTTTTTTINGRQQQQQKKCDDAASFWKRSHTAYYVHSYTRAHTHTHSLIIWLASSGERIIERCSKGEPSTKAAQNNASGTTTEQRREEHRFIIYGSPVCMLTMTDTT